MKRAPLIALALLALVAGTPASAQDWAEYRNERYGLSLRYPANIFVVERTAEAGDGQVFVANDADPRLLVGVLRNESGHTPTTYQDYIALMATISSDTGGLDKAGLSCRAKAVGEPSTKR